MVGSDFDLHSELRNLWPERLILIAGRDVGKRFGLFE